MIAHISEGDAEDINRAVSAARKAFDEGPWPKMTAYVTFPTSFTCTGIRLPFVQYFQYIISNDIICVGKVPDTFALC